MNISYLSAAELIGHQQEVITPRRIKAIRKVYGLTQVKFAELLGMKYDTLRSWEGGYKRPSSPGRALLVCSRKITRSVLKKQGTDH
ncbi:MAG: helix-turn-helix domain-containing protein [Janthinobacterium lividum]